MNSYKDLKVWQKAFNLSLTIYKLTKGFPKDEQFGLTQQLRRAAVSIFSNIAEGHGRMSDKDFSRFLYMGLGSTNELESQILLSENLNYVDKAVSQKIQKELQEIQAMLMAFIKKIT